MPMTRDVHHAYRNLGYIGEGAYGVVVKAETITTNNTHQQPQQPTAPSPANDPAAGTSAASPPASPLSVPRYVAIKQMNLSRDGVGIASDAYREIKLLRALHHPNLIALLHTHLNATMREVDLVYDYAEHDLADVIRWHRTQQRPMDARCVKSIVHQLLQGLAFLHGQWIVHRDIKPANLLIMGSDSDEHGRVKIADLGLARIIQSPVRSLDRDGEVVTIWYRAPELLLGSKHYTRAVDVWAVGCIMYELLALQPAFPGDEAKGSGRWQEAQMRKVMGVLGSVSVEQWPTVVHCAHWPKLRDFNHAKDFPNRLHTRLPHVDRHSRAYHLLSQLLAYDPAKRLTCDEALEHGWFKELPAVSGNCFKMATHELARYPIRQVKPLKRGRETGGTGAGAGAGEGVGGTGGIGTSGGGGVVGSVVQVGGMGGGMKVSGSLDSGRVGTGGSEATAASLASDGSGSTGSKKRRL